MVKEKSKEKIMAWLDSIIALHKKQHIVVDGLDLDLIEFRCVKEIQINNAHLVADALKKSQFLKSVIAKSFRINHISCTKVMNFLVY